MLLRDFFFTFAALALVNEIRGKCFFRKRKKSLVDSGSLVYSLAMEATADWIAELAAATARFEALAEQTAANAAAFVQELKQDGEILKKLPA